MPWPERGVRSWAASGWGRDHERRLFSLACWSGHSPTPVDARDWAQLAHTCCALRACPTRDLPRTTTERSIDELKARFLRLPRNRPCIGAENHVFSRKNRVYSPKAHRWA